MTERYDAAIIGAGADGLAAAVMLARKGLKTVVIERSNRPGGVLSTIEFHPGFRASPYADEIAPVPPRIHWALDLARQGAIFVPAPHSLAVWPDRQQLLSAPALSSMPVLRAAAGVSTDALARAERDCGRPRRDALLFAERPDSPPWPGTEWSQRSLQDVLTAEPENDDTHAHLAARAIGGRTTDPFVRGSALHAIAPGTGNSGAVIGGLSRLADALARTAQAAGAEIRSGLDVSDLKLDNNRVAGLALIDGCEIEARAVISTLDFKRTILSLFSWKVLPKPLLARTAKARSQ